MQIKTTLKCHFSPTTLAKFFKYSDQFCPRRCGEIGMLLHADGNVNRTKPSAEKSGSSNMTSAFRLKKPLREIHLEGTPKTHKHI